MPSKLNPYISFRNTAREALQFYQGVFGGKLSINTFGEFQAAQSPAEANLIMHGQLDTDNGFTLMASDTPPSLEHQDGSNITISLSGDDEPELRGYYEGLSQGGTILEPLEKAPWGDTFGLLKDKFGVTWMVNIAGRGT